MYIVDDIVCLDHFPLCIDINCNISPICDSNFVKHFKNVCNWKIAGDLEKSRYYSSTNKLLSAVDVHIDNISVFWRDHFSSILNSSGSSNADLKNSTMSKLNDVQYSENMIVSSRVILQS